MKARGCGQTASAISPARQVLFDRLIYLSHRLHGYNLIRSASGFYPVFLPGELHGQRSVGGYSPCSHKKVRHD